MRDHGPAALQYGSGQGMPALREQILEVMALEGIRAGVDDNPQMAMKYQITSIPAMKVFRGGEVVKTVIGAKPKPAIEADLAEFLA